MTLARSELRVSPPSEMSMVSATRKGTRCAVSVGTHSGLSFNSSAIFEPTVTSKPSKSPDALRPLKGGEFGLMPIRRTPSLTMSSRLLALAGETKKPAATTEDRVPRPRRENFIPIEHSPYSLARLAAGRCRKCWMRTAEASTVYSLYTKPILGCRSPHDGLPAGAGHDAQIAFKHAIE